MTASSSAKTAMQNLYEKSKYNNTIKGSQQPHTKTWKSVIYQVKIQNSCFNKAQGVPRKIQKVNSAVSKEKYTNKMRSF